jgi:molecular chaperone GrpE
MSMGQDDGKGSFSANIPKSVLDEALEAVERNEEGGEAGGAAAEPGARRESSELESLRTQLEMSQAAGREGFEKLKEEHDRFLRAVADLENYRKRAQRERDEVQKFGIERLLKDLFPVVDNLDRALAAAPEGDPLAGGVKLVLKTLEDALARHGVKSFHALGEAFDPRRHEAIMTVVAPEKEPGTVVMEHGRGFSLHDRLVRPALVGVAAAPGENAPPGGGGPVQGTG